MDFSEIWPRLHGAATHLPVALVPLAAALEALALVVRDGPFRTRLENAAGLLLPVAAAGALVSVASGLGVSRGTLLGGGALRMHHWFVWPAFALIVALGAWRLLLAADAPAMRAWPYRLVLGVAAGLVIGAGYWGGEIVLSH